MKQIHCPSCKRLLFKANFADIETVCPSCKRMVRIEFYTAKSILLTSNKEADNISVYKQSKGH
jgi:phage FluMu protein Com